MSTSAETDPIERVILSHHFAKRREIEAAREWGQRAHPDKDLAELLFMRGVFDRTKVSLIRKLAKMQRGSTRSPRPAAPRPTQPEDETSADEEVSVRVRDLRASPPERVGKYQILERVAQGGMGVIYKARHVELERVFALKILTPRAEANPEATARFQREAKIAARLEHPNIVRVHDAGVEDGAPYLVMDFVDGRNLADTIKEEGLGIRKAAQIARAIALALHHAHQHGVVHRDVKPDNIILDASSGEPKITDFGIVKELGADAEERSRLTQTGFTLGSPCYMSPEQAAGRHDQVDARSDVYSLAATLYEMLCEAPPHDGESIHEIMTKVVRDDVVSVRSRNPQVPRDLDAVVMKALEKELARRYATAREFAEDLGRFLDEEPVLAKPAGLGTKLRRSMRRHRAVSALLALFVVAALGGLGWVWSWQRRLAREAREERAARVTRAKTLLEEAAHEEDPRAKRSAYYEALQELELVLASDPDDANARRAKREAVLALGDHLIEAGEASFAEFVFALGAGVADEAEITSRIEAARLGVWVEKAEAAELAGDLVTARELYLKGKRALQEAGYAGERLQARIDDLDDQLAERRRRAEAEKLARLAEDSAEKGDHLSAYQAYLRAQAVAPDDREITARLEYHRGKLEEDFLLARRAALAVREDALAARQALGEGPPELEELFPKALREGDQARARAEAAQAEDRFHEARAEIEAASGHFRRAHNLAIALKGREVSRAEAAAAEERGASRFAPRELDAGRELAFRADQAFAKGEYATAAEFYARSASYYRRAARTGDSKGAVEGARRDAERWRGEVRTALPSAQRSDRYAEAEQSYQAALQRYARGDYEGARQLFARAASAYREEAEQASVLREVFAARSQVSVLRGKAMEENAREFASDDFSRARQAELSGDTALTDRRFADAVQAYGEALYRYRRALVKARPHAAGKRAYDALLAEVQEARQWCVDEKLEWKPAFKRGERRLRQAEDARERRYWNGAKRHLERALREFRSLQE